MYFVTEYCQQDNALLSKYKRLKMILSHFKKMFFDQYIHQHEVKKTNNHPILKTNDIVLLKGHKPRIKWQKRKIIKLLYGNDNLARGEELLITQKLKRKMEKLEDHFK